MTTSTLFKTIALVSASSLVLAGCASQTTSIPSTTPTPDTTGDNAMMTPTVVTATTTPEAAQPTLSKSTKTDDLKIELDNTTMKNEDFSDL